MIWAKLLSLRLMLPRLRLRALRLRLSGVSILAGVLEVGGSVAVVWGIWELAGWWAAIAGGLLAIVMAQGIGGEG